MDLEIGAVITGKVTGITKFGAFVTLAPGQSGLVHISEIANTYVSEVTDHLAVGQEVSVKVIGLDENKINLSIKAALPPGEAPQGRPSQGRPSPQGRPAPQGRFNRDGNNNFAGQDRRPYQPRNPGERQGGGRQYGDRPQNNRAANAAAPAAADAEPSFEDRLQRFMRDSDSKMSGIRQFSDKKGARRRGK